MKRFYFTFGSSPEFPYQNTYLVVNAMNMKQAAEKFRSRYPDVHKNVLNCSFVYSDELWNSDIAKWYPGIQPAEVIK